MSIVERFTIIRAAFNQTARGLSRELGLSLSAWGNYENGLALPTTHAYEALARRNINLHWLLLGEGEMWRTPPPDSARLEGVIQREEQRQANILGLGRLALLATRAHLDDRLKVLQAVAGEHPRSVTLDQLAEATDLSADEVAGMVVDLVEDKLLIGLQGGFTVPGPVLILSPILEKSDRAQLGLSAVELVLEVVDKAAADPEAGVLFDGLARVRDSRAWLKELVAHMRETSNAQHDPDGESVRIVLAGLTRQP